jgi:hypothetical protein
MNPKIFIFRAAEVEIGEAADYYDIQSPGLGSAFLDEVDRALAGIKQFSESSPIIRGHFRRRPLIKFPYSLIYSIKNNRIQILAVAHQKKRPFYWQNRGRAQD